MFVTAVNYDKFYFKQLLGLLVSFEFNSPKNYIDVYLLDFPSDLVQLLESIFPNVIFNVNSLTDIGETKSYKGRNAISEAMGAYKGKAFNSCIKKYKETTIWLDTDIIVRKDLSCLKKSVKENQLHIIYRPYSDNDETKFNSGVFVLGYSSITLRFAKEWDEVLNIKNKDVINKWPDDQRQLYLLYKKYSSEIDLLEMSPMFNDMSEFNNDSIIWHSKKKRFLYPQFKKEFDKYFAIVESKFKSWC